MRRRRPREAAIALDLATLEQLWRLYPHSFAERASGGRWKAYKHLQLISRKIAHAIAQGGGRIIVEAPPRHGKSELISTWLPTWFLDLYPERSIILASYADELAEGFGRRVRNELDQNPLCATKLRRDSKSASRFNTPEGGGMMTAGVGGPITGRGGHLCLIDDPIKNWEEAISETVRAKQKDWFNSTFYTRAEPGATIVVLMTRWHEDDLAGWLQREHQDKWDLISLPAIAEEDDLLGRPAGAALCPERYDEAALVGADGNGGIKRAVGARVWSSLYQQRPSPSEGAHWKRSDWRYWRALPERLDEILISGDLTFKGLKTSDWVVFQVWGRKGASKYLIDQVRGKWGIGKTIEQLIALAVKHPLARRKLIENKANGPAVQDLLQEKVSGIILVEPKGGKVARVIACEPQVEAHNVYLPADRSEHPWVGEFIDEAAVFPNGKHDDQVDAGSQALIYMEENSKRGLAALTKM